MLSGNSCDNPANTRRRWTVNLETGDRLGRYEILAPIGAWGTGEAYVARDTELEREVAVKVRSEGFIRVTSTAISNDENHGSSSLRR
jgi:hypothetical protein